MAAEEAAARAEEEGADLPDSGGHGTSMMGGDRERDGEGEHEAEGGVEPMWGLAELSAAAALELSEKSRDAILAAEDAVMGEAALVG